MSRNYIVGAGLAGLSCAYELCRNGKKAVVIEKNPVVGGLARSFNRKGFFCDIGPHRFFTDNKSILEHVQEVTEGNLCMVDRCTKIFMMNRFFDYPLKLGNILRCMPRRKIFKIFTDYFGIRLRNLFRDSPDDSFEDWVVNRFGNELYRLFFQEYTEKTWNMSCRDISSDWAIQRISFVSLWDTVKNTLWSSRNTPRTYVSRFYYPKTGGIGYIAESYARKILDHDGEICLNSKISKIRLENNRVSELEYFHLDTGETETRSVDHVFSTISIKELIDIIEPAVPEIIRTNTDSMLFNSVLCVYLLLDKPRLSSSQWIYIPEKRFMNNRITEFKNFNSAQTPTDKTMVCVEVTCRADDDIWNINDDDLVLWIIRDMNAIGLMDNNHVLDTHVIRLKSAYPVYDLRYREKLDIIRTYLSQIPNLSCFGRNAMFRYNNMDHSIDMGISAARNMHDNAKLQTIASEQRYFG